ncbi:MAG TPA: L,D-transpeptidase family protein, partial [Longimicrobiales bacterium]
AVAGAEPAAAPPAPPAPPAAVAAASAGPAATSPAAATPALAGTPAAAVTPAPTTSPAPASAPAVASARSPAAPSAAAASAPAAGALLGRPVPELARDATRVAPAAVASALNDFVRTQLSSSRVEVARAAAEAPLREAFTKAGLAWPAAKVYLRAFKREHQLEVWGERADGSYALVKTYAICSLGGSGLGPKIRRGDEQVPEGFYHVIEFNPSSEYHLSLRLDYPNAADLARAGAAADGLGGDIFLHGGCKSAGCLPLTDAGIEQIYWLAVQARAAGERQIPIDIFPARLDAASWEQLTAAFAGKKALIAFWTELKQGFDTFERTHRLPDVAIDANGRYHVALAAR